MRTLGGATTTEVGAAVTRPGYLIEIAFSTTVRFSSRGTISWSGQTWTAYDCNVRGLGVDSSEVQTEGALDIGNADLVMSTLILSEGVSGRAVRVWKFYGDASALADPVLLFDGMADEATISDNGRVLITLQQAGGRTLYCPRTYITPDAGFHWLPPQGQKITWNGETITLTPDGI